MALDPKLRKQCAAGDWSGALATSQGHLPFWGPIYNSAKAIEQDNYGQAAFQFGAGALDIAGVKWAWRKTAPAGVGRGGAEGATTGTTLVQTGLKFSKHGLERLAERGITKKMVEIAINKGLKFYDPKNKSINYVLKNYFASGKDLLIGTNSLTGEVCTVLRGSNLINSRMLLIKWE